MHNYKKLEIWKKSREFCSEIYMITASFPNEEKFGLTSQLRRASISIPCNIAEGSSRKSQKDFAHFLTIAIGSAYEIETQILIALDLNLIALERQESLSHKLVEIIKMISSFRTTLSTT